MESESKIVIAFGTLLGAALAAAGMVKRVISVRKADEETMKAKLMSLEKELDEFKAEIKADIHRLDGRLQTIAEALARIEGAMSAAKNDHR